MVTAFRKRGARSAAPEVPETPEGLKAAIAAAEQEARDCRAEAERLAAKSALELDDDQAEALLAQSRGQDRAARRAEARIPGLREELAEAQWRQREAAFQRFKRELAVAGRDAITKLEAAAAANFKLARLKDAGSGELGNHCTALPLLLSPAAQETPPPIPMPTPRRQARHDGPPRPGHRQVKFLRSGIFTLAGGGTAAFGDRVNLPQADAEKLVLTGCCDFVDTPAPVVGDVKMTLSGLTVVGAG